ncbi:MAG: ACT domain-containing protein [Actinobacteria bacterium]|nr:ACT domain-containing protein [Actinomycetota bacterium]
MMHRLALLDDKLCVCRLDPNSDIPGWALLSTGFFSITKTADELSVVCPESCVPPGVRHEGTFRCLKIEGPLNFSLVGVVATIAGLLAKAEISIFTISTYDTDYIMVKQSGLEEALRTLEAAGYSVAREEGDI